MLARDLLALSAASYQEPEGWQLVPKKPTDEMLSACFRTHYRLETQLGRQKSLMDYAFLLDAAPSPLPAATLGKAEPKWEDFAEAAKLATNEFGQWIPSRWLQMFFDHYKALAQQPAASDLDGFAAWVSENYHPMAESRETVEKMLGKYRALQSTPAVHAGKGDGHA